MYMYMWAVCYDFSLHVSEIALTVDNCLPQKNSQSPWNQYFQDARLKEFIQQDIVRTHPDQQFFRQAEIQ